MDRGMWRKLNSVAKEETTSHHNSPTSNTITTAAAVAIDWQIALQREYNNFVKNKNKKKIVT